MHKIFTLMSTTNHDQFYQDSTKIKNEWFDSLLFPKFDQSLNSVVYSDGYFMLLVSLLILTLITILVFLNTLIYNNDTLIYNNDNMKRIYNSINMVTYSYISSILLFVYSYINQQQIIFLPIPLFPFYFTIYHILLINLFLIISLNLALFNFRMVRIYNCEEKNFSIILPGIIFTSILLLLFEDVQNTVIFKGILFSMIIRMIGILIWMKKDEEKKLAYFLKERFLSVKPDVFYNKKNVKMGLYYLYK